jgi:ParB family chromosome partitioning protein
MTNKTGLGKGLGALLGNNEINLNIRNTEKIQEGEIIENLKVRDIEPNRNQPRLKFDDEALEELATSIKQYGVIQPIIVTKEANFYQIVAGERRWRASKKAGLTEIPAIVREYSDRTNREISLIENIQREDLNPIEKARAIRELIDKYNLTQQQLADTLGIARSSVANTIRVLNLDERVIELVLNSNLTEGHCKALLAIEDGDKQYQAAKRIIESGDSVR